MGTRTFSTIALLPVVAAAQVGVPPPLNYDPSKVSNPSVTVPAPASSDLRTPGNLEVTPSGVARYEIPIEVVRGRGGFQPSLSLEYSSARRSNGPIGIGFNIAGLSQIHRCAQTVADDDVARGIRMDAADRFCLNGQKLVLFSGTYGGDGAEYRTVPDTHVRVRSYGPAGIVKNGPSRFTVWKADGAVEEYGANDGAVVLGGAGLAWPITQSQDRSSNIIRYSYGLRKNVTGAEIERWIESIEYGNGTILDRRVRFSYQDRPDRTYSWLFGVRRENLRRVSHIEAQVNLAQSGWRNARSYRLEYVNSGVTGSSKLESVNPCGTHYGECTLATRFRWSPGAEGLMAAESQSAPVPTSGSSMLIAADFSGDGRTDLAYPENGNWKYVIASSTPGAPYTQAVNAGFNPWGTSATAYPIDYDLDGQIDLIPRSPQVTQWRPELSKGANGNTVRVETNFFGALNQVANGESAQFGDFDGDGYQDVLEQDLAGGIRRWFWRKRSGKVNTLIDSAQPFDDQAFLPQQEILFLRGLQPNWVFPFDIDGDGRDEILAGALLGGDMFSVDAASGAVGRVAGLNTALVNLDAKLLDFNGDGLTDIVTNGDDSSAGKVDRLYFRLNTGAGFSPPQIMGVNGDMLSQSFKAAEVIDMDDDGRQELLIAKYSGFISAGVAQFGGMRLVKATDLADGALAFAIAETPISFSLRSIDSLSKQGIRIIDANGDGSDDVLIVNRPTGGLDGGPATFKLFRHPSSSKPDLLERILEGSRLPGDSGNLPPVETRITYQPLTNPAVYTRGECSRLQDTTCLTGSMYVVSQMDVDAASANAVDGHLITSYLYKHGRVDKRSRSLLGFAEVLTKRSSPGSGIPHESLRSFYSNTLSKHDPRLVEQWRYARLVFDGRERVERRNLTWSTRNTTPGNYYPFVLIDQRRRYEFLPLVCANGANCLDTILPGASLDNYRPFEETMDYVEDIDTFGNVKKKLVSGINYNPNDGTPENKRVKTFNSTFDIDENTWLVSRLRAVSVQDSVQDRTNPNPKVDSRIEEYTYPQGGGKHSHLPLTHKQSSNGNTTVLTSSFYYDTSGNVVGRSRVDSDSGEVRQDAAAFDPMGFPHAARNAVGHVSYTGFDPLSGRLKIAVDANGLRSDYVYDSVGRIVETREPGGLVTRMAYDREYFPAGNQFLPLTRVTDNSGAVSEVAVDRAGRPVLRRFKGFDGIMRIKTFDYLSQGWLKSETTYRRANASGVPDRTLYEYDSLGRVIAETDADNHKRRWSYDGDVLTYTNARGYRTVTERDVYGQVLRVVDGAGTPEESARRNVRGPFGTLLSSQVEGVDVSRSVFAYDERGFMLSREDSERGAATYRYNAFGELVFSRDANGRETTVIHDELGRTRSRAVRQNGTVIGTVEHVYDEVNGRKANGMLLRATLLDQVAGSYEHRTDYFYDGLSRLSRQEQRLPSDVTAGVTESLVVGYEYDGLGRLSALTYPKIPGQPFGTKARYEYAAADTGNGRLERVVVDDASWSDFTAWHAVATDEQDRLAIDRTGDGVETRRTFDWRGRPEAVTMLASGNADPLWAEMYAYDAEGNLDTRAQLGISEQLGERFEYDPLDRLKLATHGSILAPSDTWRYDKLGNLISSLRRGTYIYDLQRPTQVIRVSGGVLPDRSYGYDAVGNQVQRHDATVIYNTFDLPAQITSRTGGKVVASFLYSGNGERVRKNTGTDTITYVPGVYERHRTARGVEHRLRVSIGRRDVATVPYQEHGGGQNTRLPVLYPHAERQGSVSLVMSHAPETPAPASIIERRSYDAFGLPRNPDWTGPFLEDIEPSKLEQGYAGHDDDRELGLVNMKGRIYDPALGRFLTPDPFVDGANASQAWNRYAYVSNNPLRYSDPTGFGYCSGCTEDEGFGNDIEKQEFDERRAADVTEWFNEMVEEADAWDNDGAWGISPLNPNSVQGNRLRREADRQARIAEQERRWEQRRERLAEQERKRQEQSRKKQELYNQAQARAKEAASALGGVSGTQATGPNALAQNGCDPSIASCIASSGSDAATNADSAPTQTNFDKSVEFALHTAGVVLVNTAIEIGMNGPKCVIGTCNFMFGFWQMEPDGYYGDPQYKIHEEVHRWDGLNLEKKRDDNTGGSSYRDMGADYPGQPREFRAGPSGDRGNDASNVDE